MGPRTRLSLLATLILLGVGLWLVSVIAPPGDTVPDYTVLNRLTAAADVVIPSLSREDEDREVERSTLTSVLVGLVIAGFALPEAVAQPAPTPLPIVDDHRRSGGELATQLHALATDTQVPAGAVVIVKSGDAIVLDAFGTADRSGGLVTVDSVFPEPYRVCRRAFSLRGWSHVTTESVFPRSTRASGAAGPRARG